MLPAEAVVVPASIYLMGDSRRSVRVDCRLRRLRWQRCQGVVGALHLVPNARGRWRWWLDDVSFDGPLGAFQGKHMLAAWTAALLAQRGRRHQKFLPALRTR